MSGTLRATPPVTLRSTTPATSFRAGAYVARRMPSVRYRPHLREQNSTEVPMWHLERLGIPAALLLVIAACQAPVGPNSDERTGRGWQCPPVGSNCGWPWLDVRPENDTLPVGDTLRISAVYRDSVDRAVPGVRLTWAAGPKGVVEVDSAGLVRAVREGSDYVQVRSGAVIGYAWIFVHAPNEPCCTWR